MNYIIKYLEYNESTGDFSFNDRESVVDKFGYSLIGENVPERKASFFCLKMERKYKKSRASAKIIKSEWKYFNEVLALGVKKGEKWL